MDLRKYLLAASLFLIANYILNELNLQCIKVDN
jgi:hypothetical protein